MGYVEQIEVAGKETEVRRTRKDSQKKIERIYERLEKALVEETCTYQEAKAAVDKLREIYFNRKAGNFLRSKTIQEIAEVNH